MKIQNYYRPKDVSEAAGLLQREGVPTRLLAGGTQWVPHGGNYAGDLVDLQDAGLDQIALRDDALHIGAMVRIQDLSEHPAAPELISRMAGYEGPNTFRNMGTMGGLLAAADGSSELLAALLVHETTLRLTSSDRELEVDLDSFLSDRARYLDRSIITEAVVPLAGSAASARVARTPRDTPIVAAVGRRSPDGAVLTALCGCAGRPVLAEIDHLDQLNPPSDFLGSAAYRLEMARVLLVRVRSALGS